MQDELTGTALRARAGDSAAAAEFVRASQADVWRLCAHLASREHADDLTQETYLRAFSRVGRLRGPIERPDVAAGHRTPRCGRPFPGQGVPATGRSAARRVTMGPAARRDWRRRSSDVTRARPHPGTRPARGVRAHPGARALLRRSGSAVCVSRGHHQVPRRPCPGRPPAGDAGRRRCRAGLASRPAALIRPLFCAASASYRSGNLHT